MGTVPQRTNTFHFASVVLDVVEIWDSVLSLQVITIFIIIINNFKLQIIILCIVQKLSATCTLFYYFI